MGRLNEKYKKCSICKKVLCIFVTGIIALFVQSTYCFAEPQNDDKEERVTNEEGINSIISTMLSEPSKTIVDLPEVTKTTYSSDFSWSSDKTLNGILSTESLYFKIPKYWNTKYAIVSIQYSLSQLITDIPATITFSINNKPFYSCKIKYENSGPQIIYAVIPAELLKEGFNNLGVSGYVRLYNDEGCIDDYSGANWINISKNSYARIGYEVENHNNKILYYPYPFISTMDPTAKDTAILVSDKKDNGELSASMILAANLGTKTSEENNLNMGSYSDYRKFNSSNTILVSLTKNLPSEMKEYVSPYTKELNDNGVVLFINDANGNPMLLLVSNKEEGLIECARMISDENRVDQENSNVAMVRIGSADVIKNSTKLNDSSAYTYTIESLTDGGMVFIGPFRQKSDLYLSTLNDYILSSAGKISLKFRYSENLDFTRSLITVYWGETPIASKKLTKERSSGDELTFTIPADVVGTSAGKVSIAFDLEIQDLICTPRQMDMPWAYVTKDSILYLPINTSIVPKFDTLPHPFQKDERFNQVLIVIPDEAKAQELTLAGKMLAIYGKSTDPYGNIEVCRGSDCLNSSVNYKDKNIIAVGTPKSNKFISNLNKNLYFKYDESNTKLLSNEKLILSNNYAENVGTMQLLSSPYEEGQAILVLTGAKDSSLEYIDKFIKDEKLTWALKDDCILIDDNLDAKMYRFQKDVEEKVKPSLGKKIIENKQYFLYTLASTSIMLILFLGIVFILVRNKMRNNKDK